MLRIHRNSGERDLVQGAEAYLQEAFGWTWRLEPVTPEGLPNFVADHYRLWRSALLGQPCIVLAASPKADFSTEEMGRHVDLIRSRLGVTLVILAFDALTPTRRASLLKRRLAFIVPRSQLYVPEALLDLRERGPQAAPREVERFSPTAQLVILGELLGKTRGFTTAGGLAHRYGVAAMSMSRAFDELEVGQIADAPREGRQRTLRFRQEGRVLWDAAAGRLQSPVRKVRTVVIPYPDHLSARIAGESALAHYTGLARPRVQRLAVASAEWNTLVRDLELRETETGDPEGDEIETWAYDPGALSTDMIVDPLSLHLSVRDHPDERVSMAADQLLEQMPWW